MIELRNYISAVVQQQCQVYDAIPLSKFKNSRMITSVRKMLSEVIMSVLSLQDSDQKTPLYFGQDRYITQQEILIHLVLSTSMGAKAN